MKSVVYSLIGACMLSVGCKGTEKKIEGPKLPPVAAAKPVPTELQKLLPKEHLNESNAKAQAQILEETLQREGGFAQRTMKAGEQ